MSAAAAAASSAQKTPAEKVDPAATARSIYEQLDREGWARVTRAQLGLPLEIVEAAHAAIWNSSGEQYFSVVAKPDSPEWGKSHASSVFGGVGGFTKRQFIPEQVELQTHAAVEDVYRELFVLNGRLLEGSGKFVYRRPDTGEHLIIPDERDPDEAGSEHPALFYTYAERANLTLPGSLQDIVGQTGAKPHIDCNPWEDTYGDGSVVVDPAKEAKSHYMKRRWEIDRPVQSFVSLTDCAGGPLSGGMGVSKGSHALFKKLQGLPAHGRNPRWGNLVRMTANPGGAWREDASQDSRSEVDELHNEVLGAMHYPFYRTGDLILWNRETTHAGCERNFTKVHQGRVYVNKLPLNARNDNYAKVQGEKATQGVQGHGKAKDKNEKVDITTLSEYQKTILGIMV